jgi:pilus assembly protein CpaE
LLRAIIVDSDPDSRAMLRRELVRLGSVSPTGEFASVTEALAAGPARVADVAILNVGGDSESGSHPDAIALVESVVRALPDAAVLAMGPNASASFVIQVIRAGAIEFLTHPLDAFDLRAALEKVARLRRASTSATHRGKVISVFSTKGGLGVTTLATNLAVCLAERAPERTILVDLDTSQSDVTTFLNLRPTYSVLDALENLERLDESFLRGLVVKYANSLCVLPGPSRFERVQLGAEAVRAGLEAIRAHFHHVVLDLRHDLDPGTVAALESSDAILFVTSLDVATLRSGAAGISAFRGFGLNLQKVKVVVMREDTADEVTLKHVRDTLGLPVFWKTPSDYRAVVASINGGKPVVIDSPRSKVSKSLRKLSESLISLVADAEQGLDPVSNHRPALPFGRLVWSQRGTPGDR